MYVRGPVFHYKRGQNIVSVLSCMYVRGPVLVFYHVCMCVDQFFTVNVDKIEHFSDHV